MKCRFCKTHVRIDTFSTGQQVFLKSHIRITCENCGRVYTSSDGDSEKTKLKLKHLEWMPIMNEIQQIIENVKNAKEIIESSQTVLLNYCQDKNIPQDDRWNVWVNYIEKTHQSWLPSNDILDSIVSKSQPERYRKLDYGWFFDRVDNDELVSEITEIFLQSNTGSYEVDW